MHRKHKILNIVPNVVKTIQIGNTTVEICDNFIPKDPVERQKNIDAFLHTAHILRVKNAARDKNMNKYE